MHSLTNNLNSKHRLIRLNLTFEIFENPARTYKNEIMLRLTFERLADRIRIQHWPGRNFICRSGWILLNTKTKTTLTFWCCSVRSKAWLLQALEQRQSRSKCGECIKKRKRLLYQHYKQWCSFIVSMLCQHWFGFNYFKLYEMNEGSAQSREKQFDPYETVCYCTGAHLFDKKSACIGFLFSLSNKVWMLLGLTAHREAEVKLHVFTTAHLPVYLPPKQMRPRQESAEEIHTTWIRNTSTTGSHAASEIAFYTCAGKKGASVYKITKLILWLQNDSQIYIMIMSKNDHNIKKFLVMLVTHKMYCRLVWDH